MTSSPSPTPGRPSDPSGRLILTTARSGWVWVGLLAVLGVFSAVDCFRRGYGGLGITVLVWAALICWLVALVFLLPRLGIDAGGATVRNVLSEVRIPWARLSSARTTYFVELVPDTGAPVRVWAAPQSAMKRGKAALRERAASDVVSTPAARESDLAGGLMVERDRALAAAGGILSPAVAGAVTRTFLKRDWSIAAALAVLALVSLLFA